MAQTFAEFRDKKSDARRKQYSEISMVSLGVSCSISMVIVIIGSFLAPSMLMALACGGIAFAALFLIPLLVIGIKAGFDFISDLISYHFSKDNKDNEIKIEKSYAKTTENLNTTTTHPTNKVEKSSSLIDRFNQTTVGMKIQYVLSFIAGSSEDRRKAMLHEIQDKMFEL